MNLIYYMQSLDVGNFQSYKHWHDVVIKKVFVGLGVKYSFRSVL